MTVVILALLGGVVGGALLSDFGGFVLGAVVGGLAGWVADLRGPSPHARAAARSPQGVRRAGTGRRSRRRRASRKSLRRPHRSCGLRSRRRLRAPPHRPRRSPPRTSRAWRTSPAPAAAGASRPRVAPRRGARSEPSAFDALLAKVWRWFTTGNVPVKVGVVLSLFGVGFLVKEGIDREWLVLPLEVRLMFVALFGIGLLVLGWRLRTRQRIYALSVQGGGIGVLYLTIYASFALYDLLPAGARVRVARGHHGGGRRAGRAAGCARARGARHSRRLPRARARVDGLRQSCRAIQLLRAAERGDSRHRLVQGVARAQRARLRVHVRHRHAVGNRRLLARTSSRRPSRSSCCSR